MAVDDRPAGKRTGSKPRQQHREHSRIDQDMFAAKNNGEHVKFGLAAETYFTDAECAVVGLICQVDKYDVEILMDNHPDGERKVWLKKSMVVSTEVLR